MKDADNKHIGGLETGPAVTRYLNDTDPGAAQPYVYPARWLLGDLKRQMQLANIKWGQTDVVNQDGVKIHAQSNMYGLADIDEIWIDTSALAAVDDGKDVIIGFIVHAINQLTLPSYGYAVVKGPGYAAGEYMDAYTGSGYGDQTADYANCTAGIIPNTYDYDNYGRNFPYWSVMYGDDHFNRDATGNYPNFEIEPPVDTHTAYAPQPARRNQFNHIAIDGKPTLFGTYNIAFDENKGTDSFVAVIPGNVTYSFQDAAWTALWGNGITDLYGFAEVSFRVSTAGNPGPPPTISDYIYPGSAWYVSSTAPTRYEFAFQSGSYSYWDIFNGAWVRTFYQLNGGTIVYYSSDGTSASTSYPPPPARPGNTRVDTSVETFEYHSFTPNGVVKSGTYIVQGQGINAEIIMIGKKRNYIKNYVFDSSNAKELTIDVGKQFSSVDEIFKERTFTIDNYNSAYSLA